VAVPQASAEAMRALLLEPCRRPMAPLAVPFPAHARSLHALAEHRGGFGARNLALERVEGLGLAGPARWCGR
jgi:hypothetical protein